MICFISWFSLSLLSKNWAHIFFRTERDCSWKRDHKSWAAGCRAFLPPPAVLKAKEKALYKDSLLLSWKDKEKSLYNDWLLLVLWLGVLCLPSCLPQLSDGDVVSCVPINMQPAVVNAKLLKVQVISQPCHSLSSNLSRKSKQNHCKIYYKRLFYLKRISHGCHVLAYWRPRAWWHIRKSFGDSVSSIRIDKTSLKTLLFE